MIRTLTIEQVLDRAIEVWICYRGTGREPILAAILPDPKTGRAHAYHWKIEGVVPNVEDTIHPSSLN